MSDFADLGRMVLKCQITTTLGDCAGDYDVTALVNAFVTRFGFVDVGEVDNKAYWALVKEHEKA